MYTGLWREEESGRRAGPSLPMPFVMWQQPYLRYLDLGHGARDVRVCVRFLGDVNGHMEIIGPLK